MLQQQIAENTHSHWQQSFDGSERKWMFGTDIFRMSRQRFRQWFLGEWMHGIDLFKL